MKKNQFIVVGKGGREHCLLEILKEWGELYTLGGSDAFKEMATPLVESREIALNAPLSPEVLEKILEKKEAVVIIGSEQPLAAGWVDQILEKNPHQRILGPTQSKARLESSKAWAKNFLQKHNVPTARWEELTHPDQFWEKIKNFSPPYVIKADGLASGKGVGLFQKEDEAFQFVKEILEGKKYGDHKICLIEECLSGTELSAFLLLDGTSGLLIGKARDYKRLEEGDRGPNTGGMGAYTPLPDITGEDEMNLFSTVIRPILKGLQEEDLFYKGFLYLGLMKTDRGFSILELNVRLGDPEAQVILPLLKHRAGDLFLRASEGNISSISGEDEVLQIDSNFWVYQVEGAAVCVVLASPGYPRNPQIGISLPKMDDFIYPSSNLYVFHAGTKKIGEKWTSSQGRVLNIVSVHHNLSAARQKCYETISRMNFSRLIYRNDIAQPIVKEEEISRKPKKALVSIVMGSTSDLNIMKEGAKILDELKIPYNMRILSAHRSPEAAHLFAKEAEEKGLEVILVGAGGAAHLAGVIAAQTILPVIGVPMETPSLGGMDSLYSTVQMPSGIPVATMAIGKAGARNGAVMAALILGSHFSEIRESVRSFKENLNKKTLAEDVLLQEVGYEEFLNRHHKENKQ